MTAITYRIEKGDRALVKNSYGGEREVRILDVKEDAAGNVRKFIGRESFGPDVTVTLVYTPAQIVRLYKD